MLEAITAVSAKLFVVVDMLTPHLARVFQRTKGADIGAAALIVDDPAVFDAKDSIRERHDARIVRDDEHGARRILGELGQHRHHCLAVFAVERRSRLVSENHRRIADDGARDRDALLLAAGERARK